MAIVNLLANPNLRQEDFLNTSWVAEEGCAIKRTTKQYHSGNASLLITATSTTAVARSNSYSDDYKVFISPGSEYRAVSWFSHATVGRLVYITLAFYGTDGLVVPTGSTVAASSGSQAGTTLTITTSSAHGLSTGDMVNITGFGTSSFNLSQKTIFKISNTQFSVNAGTTATLTDTSGGTVQKLHAYSKEVAMGYRDWTLASITATAPQDAQVASLRIAIEDVDTASLSDRTLYIDDPSITSTTLPETDFYLGIADSIPEYVLTADSALSNPDKPLARFLDLLATQGQNVSDLYDAINYVNLADGGDPSDTSSLVDPADYPNSLTKKEWLPWIAQLLAVRSADAPGGSTSWSALAQFATWNDWEDSINTDAAPSSVAISSGSRTDGIATINTSTAHGLSAGDSVVISSAGTYNGVYVVATAPSTTQFTYSQVLPLEKISRSGSTASVKVAGAHPYSASQSVVVADVNTTLNGTVTVVAVSADGDDLTNSFTYTTGTSGTISDIYGRGYTYPANDSTLSSGSMVIGSDLNWTSIEQFSPYPVAQDTVLAYLIRTGASGIWAGTLEGMKRAARLALTGRDIPCLLQCIDGTLTITTDEPHEIENGSTVEIYASSDDRLNRVYQSVTLVSPPTGGDSSSTQLTMSCGLDNVTTTGWITNKIVTVTRRYWSGVPSTISTTGGVMYITFNSPIPLRSTVAPVYITGTGNGSVDTTHNPASVTISSDRRTVSFASAVSLGSPLTPANARVRLIGDDFCFLVKTLESQTDGAGTVLAFADQAKPAGGVVSHEYT